MRAGDREPSVCTCLPCGRPLEGFEHSQCDDPVELLACPEHRRDEGTATPRGAEPWTEPGVFRYKDGNPIVGFCLWCNKDFYSMEEVEAHNADNMKGCPVHQELVNQPGGYPYMPPALQAMLEQAGPEDGPGENGDFGPKK